MSSVSDGGLNGRKAAPNRAHRKAPDMPRERRIIFHGKFFIHERHWAMD
jgi:hypothetical protein